MVIQTPPTGVELMRTIVEKRHNYILVIGGYRPRTRLEHIEEGDDEEIEESLTARFKKAIT